MAARGPRSRRWSARWSPATAGWLARRASSSVSSCRERAGSALADQAGVDDHVVDVLVVLGVEVAAAGDQPQARGVDVAVDGVGGEVVLVDLLDPVDGEEGGGVVD